MTDPDNKSHEEPDYLDVTEEFESDISDTSDYDEDSEEGIFAPSEAIVKKKSGSGLMVTVAIAALLGGAGFYYYTNGMPAGISDQIKALIPGQAVAAPDVAAVTPPEQAPAAPETPTPPETAAVTPPENTDVSIPGLPKPASDFENNEASATPEVAKAETPPEPVKEEAPALPVTPAPEAEPVTPPPAENVADAPKAEDMPAPPPAKESIAEAVPAAPEKAKMADKSKPEEKPAEEKAPVSQPLTPMPDQAALAKPEEPVLSSGPVSDTKLPKKSELEAARENVNVKKPAETKTVYFDAPNGKALTDLPPPSINPMKEPGESIIIVHKARTSDAIIEKGEDSGFIESKLISANRALKLGMYDAALDFYNQLLKKNSNDPRILMGRAVTLQKMGDTQAAIDAYQDVLNIEPNNPEAITNLMGLIGKTKPAVALQNLLDLREKYPKNPAVAAQLGVAYTQSGNPQDGLKYLNIAAGLQPDNPLHYYNMAVVCEHLNDRENAIKYYEQALDTYSVHGANGDPEFSREKIYDRLAHLRGN